MKGAVLSTGCSPRLMGPLFAAIASVVGASAIAQVDSSRNTEMVLEEVIVTARKREESLQDTPVAISAFSAEALEVAGIANTRDLQESVMSIRMIPMSVVFNRFPRMLRDLAHKLGKKVEMVTVGEATELDKGLVEKITDPLTHLVRNSCDHGIEPPADRVAKGKPETGTITLVASHQGGSIVIEVSDGRFSESTRMSIHSLSTTALGLSGMRRSSFPTAALPPGRPIVTGLAHFRTLCA